MLINTQKRTGRALCLALALCLLPLAGCGGGGDTSRADLTPSPAASTAQPTPAPTPTPTPMPVPEAESGQVTAYYFENIDGVPNLYAAMEITNAGAVPAIVESIKVTFNTGEKTQATTFTPPITQNDIIEPGETIQLAVWLPYEGERGKINAQSAVTAAAEATLTPVSDSVAQRLVVEDITLLQNYPGFATVSGTLVNKTSAENFDLTLVYLSFYDAEDKLIGTYHFTKNLSVPAEESRNFVVHMQSLPIEDICGKTARIVARGIGID